MKKYLKSLFMMSFVSIMFFCCSLNVVKAEVGVCGTGNPCCGGTFKHNNVNYKYRVYYEEGKGVFCDSTIGLSPVPGNPDAYNSFSCSGVNEEEIKKSVCNIEIQVSENSDGSFSVSAFSKDESSVPTPTPTPTPTPGTGSGAGTGSGGTCGLPQEFMDYLANILRLIRYIGPALLIIMSILDFIKAIGSSKDEEMKRAMDKFLKRLIAIVLLFLLPLIIGFLLNLFLNGRIGNDPFCGLI